MPLNSRIPSRKPRPLPAYLRRRTDRPERKSGWDKAVVIVQAIGALAIFVSLAGVYIGVRQFNAQQKANAEDQLNQQRQATLNGYLDDMSALVLTDGLATAKPGSSVTAIAVARTATALRNLDGPRKGTLVRFLWEAGLINGPQPILYLYHMDLNGAVLQDANLYRVYLSPLGLTGANFSNAQLKGAYLSGSVLIGSDLEHANLACWNASVCTDLSQAYLMRSDLTQADLTDADLTGAHLEGANLSGAVLKGGNLRGASYNTRPVRARDQQGNWVTNMPTQWPAGFNPEAAGAACDDC